MARGTGAFFSRGECVRISLSLLHALYAIGEPVVANVLPDVLNRVEFWGFWRQGDNGDVGQHDDRRRNPAPKLTVSAFSRQTQSSRGAKLVGFS